MKAHDDEFFTPDYVYEAVKEWAVQEYRLEGRKIVRPFWPGGDYERHYYPVGCVVIDNPPYSILARICDYYTEHKIDYFLFAPGLTVVNTAARAGAHIVCTGVFIHYDTGVRISTSFLTNLEPALIRTAPDLYKKVRAAVESRRKPKRKYSLPENVTYAAELNTLCQRGVDIRIHDGVFIRSLDSMREEGRSIYGAGFLISDDDAQRKAEAKAHAPDLPYESTEWTLSEREKKIIKKLRE